MKIFVADDDRDDFEMLNEAFQNVDEPPELEYFENGAELLSRLKKVPVLVNPELIVLDLNMPKIDGIQALREIKEDLRLQRIPVFMHSTSKSIEQIELCRALGAAAYMVKGRSFTSFQDLALTILRFIGRQRERIPGNTL